MNITKICGNQTDYKSFKSPDKEWEYKWEDFYYKKQSSEVILKENWFKSTGIGLVLGWNNYHAIDVDNIHPSYYYGKYYNTGRKNAHLLPIVEECLGCLGLPEDYPWVVASGSGNGFHIIFKAEKCIDDTIGAIAYTPNERYIINPLCSERVFERMELRWKDHLILPPSIHRSGKHYEFINGDYPISVPATLNAGEIDCMILHFCGRISIKSYNYNNIQLELAEMGKFYATYDSWNYTPEHKDDGLKWLEESATPEALNTIGVKYVLGRDVEVDKIKALKAFKKSTSDLAYFNLASLIACGYFEGTHELVEYYLSKIQKLETFVTHDEQDNGLSFDNNNHFDLIRENAKNIVKNGDLYLFFDTETTGLPKKYNAPSTDLANWPRLVQISWIVCDNKGNRIIEKDYIVKPNGFTIPADAIKVHKISTDIASTKGVEISYVLQDFMKDCSIVKHLVGHNIDYDKKIVGAELIRLGMPDTISLKASFCTMKSTVDFCRIRNFPFGYKFPSLQELYKRLFGKSFDDAHNATSDINATFVCFWELRKRGLI